MLMRNEWVGRHTIPGALLYVCFFCAPSFLAARAAVHAAAAPAPVAQAGGKAIAPPLAPAKIHPASSAPKTIEFATIPTTAVPVQAAVSPDGKLLAYCSPQTEGATIWIRELITGVERQLLPLVYGECRDIAFSPDGQSVFYVMRLMDSDSAMRVSLAGGSPPTRVVSDLDSRISLSPESKAIAFLRYDQVAKL